MEGTKADTGQLMMSYAGSTTASHKQTDHSDLDGSNWTRQSGTRYKTFYIVTDKNTLQ